MPSFTSRIAISLGALAALGTHAALADNWQFNPRLAVGGEYDDNYRLLPPGSQTSVTGGYGDVRLQFLDAGQVDRLEFTPEIRATYFPSDTADDTTNGTADFNWQHQGLTTLGGVDLLYSNQSTLNTERQTSDIGNGVLGNPAAGDSGYLSLRNRQELIQVKPTAQIELTPRDKLSLDVLFTDVRYDKFIPGTNVGYKNTVATAGWLHDWTQRSTLTLDGFFSLYDVDLAPVKTKSYGLSGRWSYKISGRGQAYVAVGVQNDDFGQNPLLPNQSRSQAAYTAGAGLNWSFQLAQVFADFTRTVNPSSTGYSVVRDQVRARFARNLSPLLVAYVGANAFKDAAAQSNTNYIARTYALGTAGFEWRILRAWSIAGEYNFTRQAFSESPDSERSNSVTLSLIYEPHREIGTIGQQFRTQ